MFVVTGTKRSGTSMWMQILIGAGFPYFGERFLANWESTLRPANPDGFYETLYRRGIVGGKNLDPTTGATLDAKLVQRHAVKIFIPGVLRTDRAYLGRVIASMRDFREYERSRRRMWQMEDEAARALHPSAAAPARIDPVYEWWSENYTLLCDALRRRYPINICAYDTILRDPEGTLRGALAWLGGGDLKGALAAIKPEHRTQHHAPMVERFESRLTEVFDALYDTMRRQRPLTPTLIKKLSEVNTALLPGMRAELERVQRERGAAALAREGHDDGSELAGLELLTGSA